MSPAPFARATALVAALALTTSARAQQPNPVPLPLPVPKNKPENKSPTPDNRVTMVEKGPVHEGFAQPGAVIRGKGIIAPKAPPAPVNEVPPIPKPDGADVQWVAGYWQWDADRGDFIWVCGCYRVVPGGRTWEPGRWKESGKEWAYFPGYWRPTDAKTISANLPEPPAPKDDGPIAPNTNPNAMWVPGVWAHKDGTFQWQPGYWPPGHGNLIWQQAQYVLTETGFAFVPGYWDSPLEERGVLYAPMYFSLAQREKRGWAYRPEYAISFGSESKWGEGGAFDTLSIGPNYNSYFIGGTARVAAGNRGTRWGVSFTADSTNDSGASYQSWDATAPGYTNPLWQHYVRLNRTDSGLAKGTPADTRAGRNSANPLAFVEPGLGCLGATGCGVGGFGRTSVGYQHVSRHGSVTTGVVRYRGIAPGYFGW